jgi:hypothetical protein
MTLGTGISLSMVVIAVVALYGITRDRWNWRRVKRTAFVCLGVILLVWYFSAFGVYLHQQIPTVVSRQIEYAGVRLGMSQDEVLYIKGYPSTVWGRTPGI